MSWFIGKKMNPRQTENYLDLGPVSLHAKDVNQFTTDLDRFQKYLPEVKRLWLLEPGSEEEKQIWASVESEEEFLITVAEYWDFVQRLAYMQRLMAGPRVKIH